jgi:hypothetical protein
MGQQRSSEGLPIVSGPIGRKIFNTALKNGASSNMGVDGSVTPVVFKYEPGSADVLVREMSLLAEVPTVAVGNQFIRSTLATLTNGLLIEFRSQDEPTNYVNAKRTRDLIELSDGPGIDIISGTTSLFRVTFWLPDEGLLLKKTGTYATPETIKATVRDNLSTITILEIFFQGVKL